jgi:alanine racemase
MHDNCVAEISIAALRGNIRAIRKRIRPGLPLCAAVKADAYGHGLSGVLGALTAEHVERLAVANLDEALAVRALGWHRPVLCLGAPLATADARSFARRCRDAVAADLHVTISDPREAQGLAEAAVRLHRPAHVEIKIDSGMGRMGLMPDAALEAMAAISRCPDVIVEGVYTHFATADDADDSFARDQLRRFQELQARVRQLELPVRCFHAANSAAIFRLPAAGHDLDLVRPGICLYGYWDAPVEQRPADLTPAMRVVSRLVAIRRVPAGHCVGYGRTFTTIRPSTIGVVPVGYADGYRRLLSNNAVMTLPAVRDQPARGVPVVGRVSMDQTTVDLTEAGDVRPGDPVVVIDNDPAAPNSVEAIARRLGTISYEITCLIGRRVRRTPV